MNACPPASPQRKSNRDAGSATAALSDAGSARRRVTQLIGEVDEDAAARRSFRRKREPGEPLLAAGNNRRRQIEEVGG
jgi:hypothetical protein